jgi:hypothetical protein
LSETVGVGWLWGRTRSFAKMEKVKMKKGILVEIVVILLAVVGGGVYVFSNVGDLIKQVVEELGSKATKSDITYE